MHADGRYESSDFDGLLPINTFSTIAALALQRKIAARANEVRDRERGEPCRKWWHVLFRQSDEVFERVWNETAERSRYVERWHCTECKKFWNVSYDRAGKVR